MYREGEGEGERERRGRESVLGLKLRPPRNIKIF